MNTNRLLMASILISGTLVSAHAGEKEDLKSAIDKLAEKGNYSWASTVQRPDGNNRFGGGTTVGKTADGMIYMMSSRGDRNWESLSKGENTATKGEDGWEVVAPRGDDGDRRGRWRRGLLRNVKAPSESAEELLESLGEITKDGDAYTGTMTEEAAKSLVTFRGGRNRGDDAPERPEPTGVTGTAKFWVADGILSKYESVVTGNVSFNGNEMDLGRTTTIEIKDVGTTTLDVPEDIKMKMAGETVPAEEASVDDSPAED